jgi:hypothetical protein
LSVPNWQIVLRELNSDEPNYPKLAASLQSDSVKRLEELARDGEPMIASKATYLASLVRSPGTMAVIDVAARRSEPVVRVAAAAALGKAAKRRGRRDTEMDVAPSLDTLDRLLADEDPGVRKYAEKSAQAMNRGLATTE